jgi:hypothetical protein
MCGAGNTHLSFQQHADLGHVKNLHVNPELLRVRCTGREKWRRSFP